ncbi:MAG: ABC-2 transporter permease [Anaerolineae bacterium]|nr:ABC-2 transporter permease [Anaerolineae bacterium]NUQ03533.1 hypothetical protein [Anaerolineae bacterium]
MNAADLNGHLPPEAESPHDPAVLEEARLFLQRWEAPAPDPAARSRLMAALTLEMATQRAAMRQGAIDQAERVMPRPVDTRRTLGGAWLLLWSQTWVIHPLLWMASALVISLGALVSLTLRTGELLPLTLVAPVVAAFGVALLYGQDSDPAIELILATPVSPRIIVLARLALVFGFNLLLTLAFSAALSLLRSDVSLGSLVLDWFAPMTLLSGIAFFASALFFDPLASALFSLIIWALVVARHLEIAWAGNILDQLPDLLRPELQLPMIIIGVIVGALALARVEYEEKWTEHAQF